MLVPTHRSVTNLFLAKSKGSALGSQKAAQVSSTVWATLTELLLQQVKLTHLLRELANSR